jgi:hypothetical protein
MRGSVADLRDRARSGSQAQLSPSESRYSTGPFSASVRGDVAGALAEGIADRIGRAG